MDSETRTVIHIGLPKACSTYLQQSVAGLPDIRLIEHPELLQLRVAAFGDAPEHAAIENLRKMKADIRETGAFIISDERLSSWRHTDFRWLSGSAVRSYQKRCATLLRNVFGNCRILLLSRNPRSWLASIHAQYVKAGESKSLADFCEHNWEYLIQASRLDDLVVFYSEQFGSSSVRVFPVEASNTPNANDWRGWVNKQCGDLITWPRQAHYQGLDSGIKAAQRNMNRIIDKLAENSCITSSESATFKAEIFRFVERTLVDNSNNQRRLRRYIAAQAGPQDENSIRQQSPPDVLVDEILKGMTRTLRRPEFRTVLSMYR
ncbi:MAG: hypothetical protein WD397_15595 [Wenzhouxiangellaceae bacterium]